MLVFILCSLGASNALAFSKLFFRKISLRPEKQITDALTFAGEDVITVYIDPDDASLKNELANELNCNVVVSDYSFGGGTRTVIEEKQILIDNSFETKFDNLYDDFSFSGGISND